MILPRTYQDRETTIYHTLRQLEVWRGFIAVTKSPEEAEKIEKDLTEIIKGFDLKQRYQAKQTEDGMVFCRGPYTPDQADTIKKYLKQNAQTSVIITGKYPDFVGKRWLVKTVEKYSL